MKLTIDYVRNNFKDGNNLTFKYNNSLCTIHSDKITKNSNINKEQKYYIVVDTQFLEMDVQYFNSIENLLNEAEIEGKKIDEIWNKISILDITGFDK